MGLPFYVSNTTETKSSNSFSLEQKVVDIKQTIDEKKKVIKKNNILKELEKNITLLSYKSYLSKTPNITSHRALINASEYTVDNDKKTTLSRKTRRLYEAIKLSMSAEEISKNDQFHLTKVRKINKFDKDYYLKI